MFCLTSQAIFALWHHFAGLSADLHICNLPPLQKSLVYTCGWLFCWYNVAVEDYVSDHSKLFLSMAFRRRKNKYCQVYSKSPKQTGIYKEFILLLPCKHIR